MTAITSVASGLWSAAGTWGGTVPTLADTVTIATGHIITLDSMTAACSTLTVNGTGTTPGRLTASTTTSSLLSIATVSTFNGTGALEIDLSFFPGVTCTIVHSVGGSTGSNGAIITGSAHIKLKGWPRKRVTRTVGAVAMTTTGTSATVAVVDATGWRIGDELVLATTQVTQPSIPCIDVITITGITAGPGPLTTITYVPNATPMSFAHATNCVICNMSSNIIWKPQALALGANLEMRNGTAMTLYPRELRDVQFLNTGNGGWPNMGVYVNGNYSGMTTSPFAGGGGVFNCAWHKVGTYAFRMSGGVYAPVPRSDNVVYCSAGLQGTWWDASDGPADLGDNVNLTLIRCAPVTGPPGKSLINPLISSGGGVAANGYSVVGGELWSQWWGSSNTQPNPGFAINLVGVSIDNSFPGATSSSMIAIPSTAPAIYTDCQFGTFVIGTTQLMPTWALASLYNPSGYAWFQNINGDPTLQAWYSAHSVSVPIKMRDNTNGNRSNAAIRLMTNKLTDATNNWTVKHQQVLPSQSGVPVRVVGYVKYDNAAANGSPPTVTITGKGITPVVFTCPAVVGRGAKFDLTVTQTSGTAGNLTMEYSHQITTNTQTYAWFSGVPDSPWIDTCRHYGFVEDATNKLRVVDPIIVLSEAAAGALSGLSITGTGPTLALNVTGTRSLSEIYDWVHAWLAANLTQPNFLTSSDGINFNCTFNLVVSGAITGAGAISMPTKTLTLTGTIAPNVTDITGSYARLTLSGLVIGSDVVVLAPGTSTERTMVDAIGATTFSWAYATSAVSSVDVCIYKPGYLPYIVRNLALTAAGVSLPVAQLPDRNYV